MKVAVIGAGSWGTTVAIIAAANSPTVLWARRPDLAERMTATRENPDYLPGIEFPEALAVTGSLEAACDRADVIVLAVPSHGFRDVLNGVPPWNNPSPPTYNWAYYQPSPAVLGHSVTVFTDDTVSGSCSNTAVNPLVSFYVRY